MPLGDELQKYTYAYLMTQALAQVPDTVDKREGSIIYDALGPACYVLAEMYQKLYNLVLETYVLTATGEWLDYRTLEFGVTRRQATAAVKRADFTDETAAPLAVPIGSRWFSISTTAPLIYRVTAPYTTAEGTVVPGAYRLTCETLGVVGHEYTGPIIPVDYLPGTITATMSTTLVPGRDVESDEDLRERYLQRVNYRAFGGNIAQYREWMLEIAGVGAVQVYPAWQGGGTVKLSVLDSTYQPVSEEFLHQLQVAVDPVNADGDTGTGLGIAPIDHKVTVVTATKVSINITATVSLGSSIEVGQVQDPAEAAIEAYLAELRQGWDNGDMYNRYAVDVYLARITVALLSVSGILNVTGVTLNGGTADLSLTEDATTQQIPVLGEVVLNVG